MPELPTKESVFGRRTTPTSSRGMYGYQAGQEAAADVRRGQAIQEIGADIGVEAEKRSKELDDLDLVRAQAYALREYTKLEQDMLDNPQSKWEDYEPKYRQAQAAAGGMVRNKALAEKFTLGLDQMNLGAWDKFKTRNRARKDDEYRADYTRFNDEADDAIFEATKSGDNDRAAAAITLKKRGIEAYSRANPDVVSAESVVKDDIATSRVVRDALSTREPDEIIAALSSDVPASSKKLESGFEANIPLLQKVEGGYVAVDGASGEPAVYGINRKWHPEAFDEANRLRLEKGDEAGKAYAAEFYKKEYWDNYNLDKYAPDQQAVLFDAMVNHRAEFRNELLSAADKGASASELIGKRHAEYARLAESDSYAPSYRGWVKRLDDVEKHIGLERTKREGVYGLLSPADEVALLEDAKVRLERDMPKRVAETMRFMPINTPVPDGMRTDSSVAARAKQVEALKTDPASYVQEHPSVLAARQAMTENPTEDLVTEYNNKVIEVQKELGLTNPYRRLTSPTQADEISKAITVAATPNDHVMLVDKLRAQYPDKRQYAQAVSEMSVSKDIPPEWAEFARLDATDPVRNVLASSMTVKIDDLKNNAKVKGAALSNKLQSELSDFTQAISTDPQDGAALASQKYKAVERVSLMYMQQGMDLNDAVTAAKGQLLPASVKGTLIIPNQYNPSNVESAAQEMQSQLAGMNLVTYAEINVDGDDTGFAKKALYNKTMAEQARPVVNGDRVVFVGPEGNELVDADVAQFDTATGELLNPDEAVISFSLSDASVYDEGLVKDASAVVKARAELSYAIGDDIKQRFFNPSIATYLPTFDGAPRLTPITPITKERFESGSKYEKPYKKAAIKAAKENKKYFDSVLEALPEAERPRLIQLAKESNAAHERVMELQAELVSGKRSRDAVLADMKRHRLNSLSAGIGYNYYDGLPDWMVE